METLVVIQLYLSKNPDILATLSAPSPKRPRLVVGFAAETDNVLENAKAKLAKKGCDFVVANPVNTANPVFGSDFNQVYFLSSDRAEEWPRATKEDIARKLGDEIISFFSGSAAKIAAE